MKYIHSRNECHFLLSTDQKPDGLEGYLPTFSYWL